jgi:hypothetical protein
VGGFFLAYIHPTPTPVELVAAPLICLASIFALIVAHELGHVIAGILAGMSFHHVRVGPLLLRRSRTGFEFAFVSKRFLSESGCRRCGLSRDRRDVSTGVLNPSKDNGSMACSPPPVLPRQDKKV